MKEDEKELIRIILQNDVPINQTMYEIVDRLVDEGTFAWKRINYILEKWNRKGWCACGVSTGTSWLTSEGKAAFEELVKVEAHERTPLFTPEYIQKRNEALRLTMQRLQRIAE